MEKVDATHHERIGKLLLTDQAAITRKRRYPDNDETVYIVFAPDDKENPRNWGYARKWYITVFVSSLNLIT